MQWSVLGTKLDQERQAQRALDEHSLASSLLTSDERPKTKHRATAQRASGPSVRPTGVEMPL